jgi:hypothetical protein
MDRAARIVARVEQDMTLPADVARCLGTDLPECKTCRRRTDPPHDQQVWTGPWELEGVPCEMRIPTQSAYEMPTLRRLDARTGNQGAQVPHYPAL